HVAWVARKEAMHILRDKMVLRVVLVLPVVQLFFVGYAARLDVEDIPTAFCDEDRTAASRGLARCLSSAGYFRLVPGPADHRALQAMLDHGAAKVAILVPRGYAAAVASDRPAEIGVFLDGSDATTARIAAGYLEMVLGAENLRLATQRLARKGLPVELPPVVLRPSIWYNPALRSRDYMVPGVVGLIILVLTLMLSTIAIVREREAGTLERLIMAPVSPSELLVGKMLPYFAIATVEAALALAVARLWFHIPLRGELWFLYSSILLFALNTLGLGLFMSSLASTQQQAILTNIFVILPSILMSGFISPIRNMPVVVQWLTYLIPLRYFLEIVRGVCLKGLTPVEVWPQLLALAGLTVVTVVGGSLALRRGL
ncbi:MAG: ABC transporter permease, partial [Armatimonadetes bacterium]|nr:ABC transporter permease [Armatimonadota bacterium]